MLIYIPFLSLYKKTYGNLFKRKGCTKSPAIPIPGQRQYLQEEVMIVNNYHLTLTFFCLSFHVPASIVSHFLFSLFFPYFLCLES